MVKALVLGGHHTDKPEASTGFTRAVDPRDFAPALDAGVQGANRDYVEFHGADWYKENNAKCFLSEDKKSGCAITQEGHLISVFSMTHDGKQVITDAISRGVRTLDCFSPIDQKVYAKFGFVETERYPFDATQLPDKGASWHYEENNHPDFVMMKLEK